MTITTATIRVWRGGTPRIEGLGREIVPAPPDPVEARAECRRLWMAGNRYGLVRRIVLCDEQGRTLWEGPRMMHFTPEERR